MKTVTLKNNKDFERIKTDLPRPESIDDILDYRRLGESLKDNGIENFETIDDLNDISFGHFIILEKILALEIDDYEKKIEIIAPYILRPLGEAKLDNEDAEKENIHTDEVMNEPIGNVMGAFNRFLELRKTYLFKTYNGVIYGILDEDDDDDEEEGTDVGTGQSAREFHTKKFFWNTMIDTVAGGDIFRYSDVVDLPMSTVMPYLAQKKSLQIVENLEHKARQRK